MTLYDDTADNYDWRHSSPSTKYLRRFERQMLQKHASGKVLDVGCGTGYHLKLLLSKGIEITGIDSSKQMIEASSINNLICASANSLPFPSESFDTVLCMFSTLNLFGDKEISEMQRVLKKGGKLIVSTASIWDKKCPQFSEKISANIEDHMKFKKVSIDKHNLSFRLFTKDDLIEEMKKHGLSVVQFKGIFIYQRPFWGRFEDFSVKEKKKLKLDKFQLFSQYGSMYLAVFSKM